MSCAGILTVQVSDRITAFENMHEAVGWACEGPEGGMVYLS